MCSRLKYWILIGVIQWVAIAPSTSIAETIEVSQADFSGAIIDSNKMMAELMAEIDLRYQEADLNVTLYPFNRSMQNVVLGKADIHILQIINAAGEAALNDLGLAYVDEPIGRVAFSMFYRKDNTAFQAWVSNGFDPNLQHDLVVLIATSELLFFPQIRNVKSTSCLKCGLQMVLKGRVDALIYGTLQIESIISQGGFGDIRSNFYQYFDLTMAYRLEERGEQINKRLSEILREMSGDGSLGRVMKPLIDYQNQIFKEAGYLHGSKLVGE